MTKHTGTNYPTQVDAVARKTALQLQSLMAIVDFKYNRHEKCMVCQHKYFNHEDGLPCESDNNTKKIVKHNRWK
jgi:hypothetical protein